MATYRSSKAGPGSIARTGIDVTGVSASFTVEKLLEQYDVIEMVKVPKGATILSVAVACGVLDDGGARILFDVGDGMSPSRFIATCNVGQAGGVATISNFPAFPGDEALGYTYTEDDVIGIRITLTPAAPRLGVPITLVVMYQMQQ